eukprot:COSAG01_NODE_373_length_17991_cov_284.890075_12_plen_47_part_00
MWGVDTQVPFAISHPSGDVSKLAIWPGEAVPEGYFQPGAAPGGDVS